MAAAEALENIKKELLDTLKCPLRDTATNLVFGKGNPHAKIMFIGEAPGEQEDMQGIPFVGRAGKELDKLLQTIGLTLDDTYIANILKYRPPKNRDPLPEEIARHTPYLVKQIRAINPRVIITLGNFSTKFVLAEFSVEGMKKILGVGELHGKPQKLNVAGENGAQDKQEFLVVPMYHPAAILYRPQLRVVIEQDFKNVAELINIEKTTKETNTTKNLKDHF